MREIVTPEKNLSEVLRFLFWNGPQTLYKIEKATGLKHATAHKTLKKAHAGGLIQIVKSKKFRTGLKTNLWFLTLTGLEKMLEVELSIPDKKQHVGSLLARLLAIAKEFPDLHPALQWASLFKEGEILPVFYLHLFKDWEDYFPSAFCHLFTKWYEQEEKYEKYGDALHALPSPYLLIVDKEKLNQLRNEFVIVLRREQKLQQVLFNRLDFWESYYREALQDVAETKQKIKNCLIEKG